MTKITHSYVPFLSTSSANTTKSSALPRQNTTVQDSGPLKANHLINGPVTYVARILNHSTHANVLELATIGESVIKRWQDSSGGIDDFSKLAASFKVLEKNLVRVREKQGFATSLKPDIRANDLARLHDTQKTVASTTIRAAEKVSEYLLGLQVKTIQDWELGDKTADDFEVFKVELGGQKITRQHFIKVMNDLPDPQALYSTTLKNNISELEKNQSAALRVSICDMSRIAGEFLSEKIYDAAVKVTEHPKSAAKALVYGENLVKSIDEKKLILARDKAKIQGAFDELRKTVELALKGEL